MRGRGEGRGGNKKGEKRRRPQKLVHTRRNPEKYPAWKTDVIAGGGNTDLCPGRQTLPPRLSLLHVWCSLEQSLIDDAVDQCRTPLFACVHARGGHFDILCDYQFVFHVLDELYILHTMLDAAGDVLRVHYKSIYIC